MSDSKKKPVLGLIGTIGAGKSSAAAAFARHGGAVVDADRIGHEVLESPAVREKILARWRNRDDLLHADDRINRRAVAAIVFANDPEREALEAMVYPEIRKRCQERIAAANADPAVKFVVLDAAVMLEAGWTDAADKFIYIDTPRDLRMKRIATRGWSDRDLASREAAQWPAEQKRARADAVIINDSTLEDLQAKIDRLLNKWGWL